MSHVTHTHTQFWKGWNVFHSWSDLEFGSVRKQGSRCGLHDNDSSFLSVPPSSRARTPPWPSAWRPTTGSTTWWPRRQRLWGSGWTWSSQEQRDTHSSWTERHTGAGQRAQATCRSFRQGLSHHRLDRPALFLVRSGRSALFYVSFLISHVDFTM